MRLIDADELKKDFKLNFGGVCHAAAAAEIIDRQPIIDPESLRLRAHWDSAKGYDYHVCCSNCGVIFQSWAVFCNYCPNCGVKMEGNP